MKHQPPNYASSSLTKIMKSLDKPKPLNIKKRNQVNVDVEDIRKTMKSKWKDPGYANDFFGRLLCNKYILLSEWEKQRVELAERSAKMPKNFKGIKLDKYSRQFPKPSSSMHSKYFQQAMKKNQIDFQNRRFSSRKSFHQDIRFSDSTGLKFQRSTDTLFGFKQDKEPKKIKLRTSKTLQSLKIQQG